MKRARRSYTVEFKQEALALVLQGGLSVGEAARRLGIDRSLLRSWKLRAESNGGQLADPARQPTALEAENARLRAENDRLRMEREILKKATAFFAKESK
jgi:transposase